MPSIIVRNNNCWTSTNARQWVKQLYVDGLVQERCNSIANALELHLSCTKPLMCCCHGSQCCSLLELPRECLCLLRRIWIYWYTPWTNLGWVGLWGFLWWTPSAKRKDHHGVSSGWSSVWHRSNTGLSSTQYEQIPIILGVWPFWLTSFFFRSITFWRAYG